MYVNEYGVQLQFGVSFDMSANTSLSFTFTKPDDSTLTVVGVLGAIPVTTPLGIFAANTYATYVFVNGNVDQEGEWEVRLTYRDATPAQLISGIAKFTVYP